MILEFEGYTIEINNEPSYSLNSAGDSVAYKYYYSDRPESEDSVIPSSKYGISVKQNGKEISSALIAETGGTTTIHDKSYIIKNNSLFICCCNKVYALTLPQLFKNWSNELDWATCFEIYAFKDDLIVHGETQITRIDTQGNIKWVFSARDIFVAPDGNNIFSIANHEIIVSDWQGYVYRLNGDGKVIEETKR